MHNMKLVISSESLTYKERAAVVQQLIGLVSYVSDDNFKKEISVQGSMDQLKKAMKVFSAIPEVM